MILKKTGRQKGDNNGEESIRNRVPDPHPRTGPPGPPLQTLSGVGPGLRQPDTGAPGRYRGSPPRRGQRARPLLGGRPDLGGWTKLREGLETTEELPPLLPHLQSPTRIDEVCSSPLSKIGVQSNHLWDTVPLRPIRCPMVSLIPEKTREVT